MMDCLANIKFLDAIDQPINGLIHQLWVGSTLISDYITSASGESVWIKRPVGTVIDVRIKSITSGKYKSKVKIRLIGEKTVFIVRSPKILLKGLNLSAKVEASISISSKVSERNEKQILKLHPQVQNRVRKLIQNVYAVHHIQLVIVQSFRTYAEQDALYAQGRSKEGNIVTYARGGESNHNFGLAVDVFPLWDDGKLHMAGKGVDAKNVKILREIGKTGKTAGLMWGGDWKGKKQDNPHFELNVGKTMSQLRQAVKEAGGDPLKVKYSIK